MKMSNRIKQLSFKTKILLVMMAGILILFAAEVLSLVLVSRSYEQKLYRSTAATLSFSSSRISEELGSIDTMVDSLLTNTAIQTNLSASLISSSQSERQVRLSQVYSTLCDAYFVFDKSSVSSLTILQGTDVISTSARDFLSVPPAITEELKRQASQTGGKTTMITDYSADYGLFLVKELKQINRLSLKPIGVLILRIDMEQLISQATAQATEYEDVSYFIFQKDQLVYNASGLSDEDALTVHQRLTHSYDVISLKSDKLFAVQGKISPYGWSYICAISYRSIYRAITLSSQSFCVIAVLAGLAVILFVMRLVPSLFQRFDLLVNNMKRFGEGHYQVPEQSSAYPSDEIGLLYKSFDAMVQKIEALINENYVNELLKKEAQIKAMESQIDPHFLYNTLNSINWRAKLLKSEEISQITTSLGNLLRQSLDKSSGDFCLEKELTLVENYIVIQKTRYHERLDFSLSIPEEFWPAPIPKFTLQPLLENAIRYGLEESLETCRIAVSGGRQGDELVLKVTNTGSSFEEGLLEKLEQGLVKPHGFGIGLLNIHRRLRLTYGAPYGLRLYNLEDEETYEEYAVAEVHLPCMTNA